MNMNNLTDINNIPKCHMCSRNINTQLQCKHNFCDHCINELDGVCPECIGKLDYVIVKRNKINLGKVHLFYDFFFCCSCSIFLGIIGIIIFTIV